jgi:hypothetical protein
MAVLAAAQSVEKPLKLFFGHELGGAKPRDVLIEFPAQPAFAARFSHANY